MRNRFARPKWRALSVARGLFAYVVSSIAFASALANAQTAVAAISRDSAAIRDNTARRKTETPFSRIRGAWDANAAVTQFDSRTTNGTLNIRADGARRSSRWLEQRAMGGALRYDHPLLQLNVDGVVRDGDVVGNVTGGASAMAITPAIKGLRGSISYERRHVPNDASSTYTHDSTSLALWVAMPKQPAWRSLTSASISWQKKGTGVWLRAERRAGAYTSDSLSALKYSTGIAQQLKNFVIGLSAGSQNVRYRRPSVHYWNVSTVLKVDSSTGKTWTERDSSYVGGDSGSTGWNRWPQATASIAFTSGRITLDAALNARTRNGPYKQMMWGELYGSVGMTSRIALVGGVYSAPPLPGVLNDARRIATLGLRVAPPALWRTRPTTVRAVSRSFDVQRTAPGQYVFTLNIPAARTVEIAGDFTAWEAVTLRQINATRWEVLLSVTPGPHRCNVRIDGAEWVPPPGVTSVKDEFNGRVGLFVAE